MVIERPFIGREDSLAVLGEALARARDGAGGIVLIAASAGTGKSRLVEEFVRSKAVRDVVVAEGRCFQGLGAPPFWPWQQAIRTWLEDDPDLLDRAGPSGALVRDAFDNPQYASSGVDWSSETAAARFRLFEAVASLLRVASHEAPRLLVLEDLHWADTSSLQLLQFLADTLACHRILVVGTDREDDGPAEARQALASLVPSRGVSRMALPALSASESEALAVALGARIPTPWVGAIAAQSGGIPLFVEELVRDALERRVTLQGSSVEEPEAIRVPERLRSVIDHRLNRLPADTLTVLHVAAVVGAEFEFGLLASSAGVADASVDAAFVHSALADAHAAGIVRQERGIERWRFSHALVREAIYDALGSRRRAHLHACVGRALEKRAPTTGDERLSELAHHFYEAAIGGCVVEALRYGERAGERAMAVCAYEDARTHFERTLQVQDLLVEPIVRDRCRLLVDLAEARVLSGNVAEANDVARRAIALARELGDAPLFARAVMAYRGIWGVVGKTDFEHIGLLQEALRRLGSEDSAMRVVLMGRLATELYWTGDHEHRIAIGHDMLAMARRLDQPATLVRALNSAHWALWQPDNPEERLAIAQENVATAERNGDALVLVGGLVWMVIDLAELGRVAEARAFIARHTDAALDLGTPHVRWQSTVMRAFESMIAGRLDEADRLALEAREVGGDALGTNAEVFFAVQMLQSAWHRGRLHELLPAAEGLSAQLPGLPAWRAALAWMYAECGRTEEAQREIEALAGDAFAAIPRDTNYVVSHAFLAEACAILGDRRYAATLFARLLPHRDHLVVVGNAAACFGAVGYFLGRLASLKEDPDSAHSFYREALELYGRQRMPLLARHCERALDSIAMENAGAPPGRTPATGAPRFVFRRAGGLWEVGSAHHPLHVRNGKGMSFLFELLVRPGVEIAAVDLVTAGERGASPGVEDGALSLRADLGDAGERLDARARAAYRARLRDLGDALREAEANGDLGRTEAARAEIDLLAAELARATGLGGRGRKDAAHADRARVNVTRAIKTAISWIADGDAPLGRHFRKAVRTGSFCVYEPDPDRPIVWDLAAR